LVFYTEHVWIFGILDKKQFGILVFWYFAQKLVSGPLHTGPSALRERSSLQKSLNAQKRVDPPAQCTPIGRQVIAT
jgi:hypothetical protein